MTQALLDLVPASIRELKAYQPGKTTEEIAEEYKLSDVIKLASNENPLGPSKQAIRAAQEALTRAERYPEGTGRLLRVKLAEHWQVESEQITLGNGSDSLISLLIKAFAGPGTEVISSEYGFFSYVLAARAHQATPVIVPAKNWGTDLDAMLAAITPQTRIIFMANPNNPTGTWVTHTELEHFLQKVPPHVLVVMDEAYCEYVTEPDYPNTLALLKQHANLVILRTFSKIYGLAGLRVGYGISHPDVSDILYRVRLPFDINIAALSAAYAALDDQTHIQDARGINERGMAQVDTGLQALGITYLPSPGNFITLDLKQDALPIFQKLLKEGVIVRPLIPYNMPQHLRVTIGLAQENERFLKALQKVLGASQ